jgi:hypothetical protein
MLSICVLNRNFYDGTGQFRSQKWEFLGEKATQKVGEA